MSSRTGFLETYSSSQRSPELKPWAGSRSLKLARPIQYEILIIDCYNSNLLLQLNCQILKLVILMEQSTQHRTQTASSISSSNHRIRVKKRIRFDQSFQDIPIFKNDAGSSLFIPHLGFISNVQSQAQTSSINLATGVRSPIGNRIASPYNELASNVSTKRGILSNSSNSLKRPATNSSPAHRRFLGGIKNPTQLQFKKRIRSRYDQEKSLDRIIVRPLRYKLRQKVDSNQVQKEVIKTGLPSSRIQPVEVTRSQDHVHIRDNSYHDKFLAWAQSPTRSNVEEEKENLDLDKVVKAEEMNEKESGRSLQNITKRILNQANTDHLKAELVYDNDTFEIQKPSLNLFSKQDEMTPVITDDDLKTSHLVLEAHKQDQPLGNPNPFHLATDSFFPAHFTENDEPAAFLGPNDQQNKTTVTTFGTTDLGLASDTISSNVHLRYGELINSRQSKYLRTSATFKDSNLPPSEVSHNESRPNSSYNSSRTRYSSKPVERKSRPQTASTGRPPPQYRIKVLKKFNAGSNKAFIARSNESSQSVSQIRGGASYSNLQNQPSSPSEVNSTIYNIVKESMDRTDMYAYDAQNRNANQINRFPIESRYLNQDLGEIFPDFGKEIHFTSAQHYSDSPFESRKPSFTQALNKLSNFFESRVRSHKGRDAQESGKLHSQNSTRSKILHSSGSFVKISSLVNSASHLNHLSKKQNITRALQSGISQSQSRDASQRNAISVVAIVPQTGLEVDKLSSRLDQTKHKVDELKYQQYLGQIKDLNAKKAHLKRQREVLTRDEKQNLIDSILAQQQDIKDFETGICEVNTPTKDSERGSIRYD